jgi:hypothetical protein
MTNLETLRKMRETRQRAIDEGMHTESEEAVIEKQIAALNEAIAALEEKEARND